VVPLDWAMGHNNLGNALARIGEREIGTARLEEAVEEYRLALIEYGAERMPLDWAMTQNNLGSALQRIGEREAGTGRLEEAAAGYNAALSAFIAANAIRYLQICWENRDHVVALIRQRREGVDADETAEA
jgi:tetratricopeptide (TPR) repeat protein